MGWGAPEGGAREVVLQRERTVRQADVDRIALLANARHSCTDAWPP